jgi:ubiquinone/menaquinone biosynthesis C-methylase UbiE
MTTFADHFSGHAPDYRTYRPSYPPELFAFLRSLVPHGERVWDCGTGNGQAAVALAEHFSEVFATDASEEQIKQAEPHRNVTYAVAPAEKCPLPDASVDLVTVAQALHWFDFTRFYAEVRRVCRPGGLLAAWSYDLHTVGPDLDPILARLQEEFVGPYWPPERVYVSERYRTIPFPFADVPPPAFTLTADWTLPQMIGYMNTWSATKRFINEHGFNPVERLTPEFAAAWGEPMCVRRIRWPLTLRIGRVS